MGYADLTVNELPKPSVGNVAVDDCFLRGEKKKVDEKLKEANGRMEELLAALKDAEAVRFDLQKTLHKVTQDKKFEKIAADGIAKKAQIYEYENGTLKGERKTLLAEQAMNRKRVKELELALNDTRAKYLKVVHQNELLGRDVRERVEAADKAERVAVEANKSLMDKLQKVETLTHINASQKRVISAQGGEMNNMSLEMTVMKEENRSLVGTISRQESTISGQSVDSDMLERQVSKLKQSVMGLAVTTSEKSLAYTTTFGETNGMYRAGSNRGRARTVMADTRIQHPDLLNIDTSAPSPARTLPSIKYSPTGKHPTAGVELGGGEKQRPATHAGGGSVSVLSPSAMPFGNHGKAGTFDMDVLAMDRISTAHGGDGRGQSAQSVFGGLGDEGSLASGSMSMGLHGESAALEGASNSMADESADTRDYADIQAEVQLRAKLEAEERRKSDVMAARMVESQRKQGVHRHQKKSVSSLSGRNKTRFTGQGLGLRQSGEGDFNPAGSAKSVLKKIMADFEANGGM